MGNNKPYQFVIKIEFERRKLKNPYYSIRAFSRDIGVNHNSISEFLSEKRDLSKKNLLTIAQKLEWSENQKKLYLGENVIKNSSENKKSLTRIKLEDDFFKFISDWYYIPLINLPHLTINKSSPTWISKKLGISKDTAKEALNRLKRLKLIDTKNGKLIRLEKKIQTTRDVPSSAIKNYHKQNLELASKSLDSVDLNLRDFSSVTMAIDKSKIPLAKELILDFKRQLASIFEESETKSDIYTLAIQLFPAQNMENK